MELCIFRVGCAVTSPARRFIGKVRNLCVWYANVTYLLLVNLSVVHAGLDM